MGAGRKTQTFMVDSTAPTTQHPGTPSARARNLRKNKLGGVIFGCKNLTINECLSKQIFEFLDDDIKNGGRVVVLNTKNLPLVGEVGLGADLVRLDGGAMCSPGFSCDSALQVTYIVRGSGRVQVVGVVGKRVLETTVKAGKRVFAPDVEQLFCLSLNFLLDLVYSCLHITRGVEGNPGPSTTAN